MLRTMASAAVTAAAFFMLLASTQAFLLPQPAALPSTSSKLGLLQQQQQVSLGVELETTMSSWRSRAAPLLLATPSFLLHTQTTSPSVARRGRSTVLSAVGLSSVPKARVGILGASGYTGAELMRILLQHPHVNIKYLTADRSAGLPFGEVFPQFSYVKVRLCGNMDGCILQA